MHTLHHCHYAMIKGQEKVERVKGRAKRAAANYADAMGEGKYEAEDEGNSEDKVDVGDVDLGSSSGSDLTDLPDNE